MMPLEPNFNRFRAAIGEQIDDLVPLQIFLQVCVKRYFFFLSLAPEGE